MALERERKKEKEKAQLYHTVHCWFVFKIKLTNTLNGKNVLLNLFYLLSFVVLY